MKLFFWSIALLCTFINTQAAFQDYTAAVVEFAANSDQTNDTIEDNTDNYRRNIRDAARQNISIIVFPEYGLTNGPVSDLAKFSIPIPDVGATIPYSNSVLEILSNVAKEYRIYVVLNLLEKATAGSKTVYYNTDIAFDRNGTLIAKYRIIGGAKNGITAGPANQLDSVFKSDFGVSFGLIGSYDLPTNISTSSRLAGVTDIILTTSRPSYLPFQHSLSLQYGFAVSNQVNVLAASLSKPSEGISGSGIYGANGTVYANFVAGVASFKLLIGKVSANMQMAVLPPFETQSLRSSRPDSVPEIMKFEAARKFSHNLYKFQDLNLQTPNIKSQVCHGSFCCNFEVNVTNGVNSTEYYKLVSFSGTDQVGANKEKIKLCAIVACETADVSSCASRNVPATAHFDGLSVQYDDKRTPGLWAQPVLLNRDLYPLYNATFTEVIVKGTKKVSVSSKDQGKVVVFGLLAQSGAPALSFSVLIAMIVSSVCILLR